MLQEAPRPQLRIVLVLLTIIQAVALPPMLCLAPFSLFAFDAPGSERKLVTWVVVTALTVPPLIVASTLGLSWGCWALKWRRTALVFAAIGVAIALAAGLFIVLTMMGLQPEFWLARWLGQG